MTRGEMATKVGEPQPKVTTRLRTNLFWLGKEPLTKKKEYLLKLGTAKVPVYVEEIVQGDGCLQPEHLSQKGEG